MENPHEQTHNALLSRIINNMESLNESVVAVNKSLQQINNNNLQTEILSQMWENYIRNSEYNLEVTGLKKEPLFEKRE
ncbi:DASH complex subunit DAD4 [Candida albicans P57072]|uniref:DASH complex subunit DAD4 n=3 Tax=Candida TaxID=5475 RepID=A0A1D8PTL5_CANAL|nr:DASH complex subunit, putative [Candida dubliniensis CD36]XP_019331103.1 Dad4p [Candida albicans SC5314]KGQ80976.1 DASH complex subunit DAD4 [Candida albicans GC75]KGQ81197.1 DASH complex subunit DAD4 [Candida albicans P37005]KGQ82100.1 DASH complex subunit DAD4 [Candida albicans P94015]KGR00927.1 DASH complex subunit DAD4 [Candida albicans P57072]KGR01172.1 DASH complex subunit DAD4 [Candida albicans P78048]KGR05689.1 DASH complex subunit DAD4 [Candida albicans P37037]KGT63070.1 DASH co|eukprot:XP_019331103.1 Dad4p [Candida albicans SC5314]